MPTARIDWPWNCGLPTCSEVMRTVEVILYSACFSSALAAGLGKLPKTALVRVPGGRAGTVSSLWFEVRAYRYVSAASSSAAMPAPTLLAGLAFAFFVPGFPRPNPFNVLSNARRTS